MYLCISTAAKELQWCPKSRAGSEGPLLVTRSSGWCDTSSSRGFGWNGQVKGLAVGCDPVCI